MFSIIIIFFALFVSMEGLSFIIRAAGIQADRPLIGQALTNQFLSISRIVGFAVAPTIGLIADLYGDVRMILILGYYAIGLGVSMLAVEFCIWINLTSHLKIGIEYIAQKGFHPKHYLHLFPLKIKVEIPKFKIVNNIFIAQIITSGMTIAAVFTVNILALKFADYTATLIQLGTVISGFGNLILNFYTMPKIAYVESTGSNKMIKDAHLSAFTARIFGIGLIAPTILFVVSSL